MLASQGLNSKEFVSVFSSLETVQQCRDPCESKPSSTEAWSTGPPACPFLGSGEDAVDCGVSSEFCFLLKHSLSFFEQTINRCQVHIIGFSSQAVLKANVWGFIFPAAYFFFFQSKICRFWFSASHISSNKNSWNKICFISI